MEQDSSDILCPACGNWFARQIIGRDVRCPSCGKLVERVATPSQSTPLSDSTDDDFAYEMSTAAEAIYVTPAPARPAKAISAGAGHRGIGDCNRRDFGGGGAEPSGSDTACCSDRNPRAVQPDHTDFRAVEIREVDVLQDDFFSCALVTPVMEQMTLLDSGAVAMGKDGKEKSNWRNREADQLFS